MKSSVILAVVALPLLALGCSAAEEPTAGASDSDVVATTKISLETSSAAESVQARLYTLLETFKDDADLGIATDAPDALSLTGSPEGDITRSVACSTSSMELFGPPGQGFSHVDLFACDLNGFNRTRAGGLLPRVTMGFEPNEVLASKLYTLMEKGAKKGGLGVVQTESNVNPPCCDMPTTSTYEIGNADAKLTCTLHGGGFTGWLSVECNYSHAIRPNE